MNRKEVDHYRKINKIEVIKKYSNRMIKVIKRVKMRKVVQIKKIKMEIKRMIIV